MRPSALAAGLLVASLALMAVPAAPSLPVGPTVVAAFVQFAPAALAVPLGTPITVSHALPVGPDHTFTSADSLEAAFADQANDPFDTNCAVDDEPGEDERADTCSVPLDNGASFTFVPGNGGTFVFYCKIHLLEKMVVVLQAT